MAPGQQQLYSHAGVVKAMHDTCRLGIPDLAQLRFYISHFTARLELGSDLGQDEGPVMVLDLDVVRDNYTAFARSLPVLSVFVIAWALGEAWGYLLPLPSSPRSSLAQ